MEDIRAELIEILEDHLSGINIVPKVVYGQAFYFMQSRIIEIPAGFSVTTLKEFYDAMKVVDASAIYNHIYEARHRDNLKRSDFAIWLETSLNKSKLASKIERIDSYMYSLEGMRKKILELCEQEL